VQEETSCQGFEHLAQRNRVRGRRTLYRWRGRLGSGLRVVPSFSVERLGLSHLHLVIANPSDAWLHFPYALEHAWLTQDFLEDRLYLHCLVPAAHKKAVGNLVRECQRAGWCTGVTSAWSASGWQELSESTENALTAAPAGLDPVLREHPFVVPAIFESWNHPESLAAVWTGITAHIGECLRQYLPHGRIYQVNGKTHVRQAYEVLSHRGLFRQYIVRYEAWATESLEVFLFLQQATEWIAELQEALRPAAAVIETFTADDGTAIVRAVGHDAMLHVILGLRRESRAYVTQLFLRDPRPERGATVRFCYELLFDPRTGTWLFPHDAILAHMTVKL
jgi:hypothetical protein